jgi:hypothetical protein
VRTRAAIVALAVVSAVVPLPPGVVERWYSKGVYRLLQPWVTSLSNRVPFALFDAVLVIVPLAWIVLIVADAARRQRAGRVAGRAAVRLVVWSAVLYLGFVLLWGFNYRREPLTRKLRYDNAAVTPDAARDLWLTTIDQLNTLHAEAHRTGWVESSAVDAALLGPFATAVADAAGPTGIVPGRPKRSILDWYFRRAGVSGMTDPYFLETMTASDLLPFERPSVVAHEWAHLAGFADEGEASFIGWLACMRSGLAEQYSGWIGLYGDVQAAVGPAIRRDTAARLAPGPRADLQAINARLTRELNPRVSAAGWRAYDSYLKANRVEAGIRSYTEVVRLVLGSEMTAAIRQRPGVAKEESHAPSETSRPGGARRLVGRNPRAGAGGHRLRGRAPDRRRRTCSHRKRHLRGHR